ncbi:MAG: tetratricopeptide repeat protein [Longimicrobiales bacterium]|nr:tetratricopeptide repeat protein [Longimicrobiales bacterium]
MAKKHPTSSRVHRQSDVPDDAFVGTIRRVIDWVQDNQREAIIGAAAIAIVAGGAVWFVVQQRSLESTAQTRLSQVQQTVASGNIPLAVRDLQSYLDTFGGTEAADQARIILADLLIAQEQPEAAIDALGNLPSRLDAAFGIAAARIEAAALELLERYDDAIQAYLDIADNARFPFQRREALADAGRVQLQHGDPEAAVDLFDRVLESFEEGQTGRGYYEMLLAEARARARTGQGSTTVPAPAEMTADSAATS